MHRRHLLALAVLLVLTACGSDDQDARSITSGTPPGDPTAMTGTPAADAGPADLALRDELLAVLEQDQAVRTGGTTGR